MKLSSTTFLRISALILLAIGAYGIYSWQMKAEKIIAVAPDVPNIPNPWYYYAIPLLFLIIFGWAILAKHPFTSPARKLLMTFALFCGIAFFAVKSFDSLPSFQGSSSQRAPVYVNPPPPKEVNSPRPQQAAKPVQAPVQQQALPSRPSYSYEQCWEIARQAYNNDSVAVPPECQQARENYKQRQEDIARDRQQREQEEQERRRQAEQARREQEERDRQIAERERREQEARDRRAEQARIEKQREQERRLRELGEGIRRIIKNN